jgi:hypothetical protein
MVAFVALYEGDTANSASLIALSSDQRLVGDVARRIVWEREPAARPYLKDASTSNEKTPQGQRGGKTH